MEKNKDKHHYATYPLRVYCSDAWDALVDYSKRTGTPMNKLLNSIIRDYTYEFLSYQLCYTIEERKAFHKEYLNHNFFAEIKESVDPKVSQLFLMSLKKSLFVLDTKTNDLIKWVIQLLTRNSTTDNQRKYIEIANNIIKICYKDINEIWMYYNNAIGRE